MTLTKDRLIEYVKSKSEAPLHQCREVVEIMLEQVKNALEKGEEVKISGFGKWEIKKTRKKSTYRSKNRNSFEKSGNIPSFRENERRYRSC
jgi:integration host factor subunit alpha